MSEQTSAAPVLAIDIGGSHVSGGVYLDGQVRDLFDVRREPHSPIPDLARLISDLAQEVDASGPAEAVGIALAGVVDGSRRKIVASENLGPDVPPNLVEQLEDRLGLPVFIDTDVFCFGRALADEAPSGTHLLVAIGTGIGHAVVINGTVHEGRGRHANRFGHITVEPGGRQCYCGKFGCVCQYSAGHALQDATRDRDGTARAHEMLARALASAVQLISPDEIVLVGGPIQHQVFDLHQVIEAIHQHSEAWMVPPLRALRDPVAVYRGAALMAIDQLGRRGPSRPPQVPERKQGEEAR